MKIRFALLAASLLTMGSAQAATVTYYLDQTNTLIPADGTNYVSVTISSGADCGGCAGVRFDVTILGDMPVSSGGSYGIDAFTFNYIPANPADATITGLPAGWGAGFAPPPNQGDGFGTFDGGVQDTNNPQDPTLSFLVNASSSISDYYDLSTGGQTQGYSHFAAHVRGFVDQDPAFCDDGFGNDTCVTTSAWFGDGETVIPVPAAAWMFGSALGLLGWARRRGVAS